MVKRIKKVKKYLKKWMRAGNIETARHLILAYFCPFALTMYAVHDQTTAAPFPKICL